jgi:ribosomal protein L30E
MSFRAPQDYTLSVLDIEPKFTRANSESIVSPKEEQNENNNGKAKAVFVASEATKMMFEEVKKSSPLITVPVFCAGLGFGYSRGSNAGIVATLLYTVGSAVLGVAAAYFYTTTTIPKLT